MLEEVGFDRRLRSGLDGFVAAVIRFDSIKKHGLSGLLLVRSRQAPDRDYEVSKSGT